MYRELTTELFEFIEKSPSCFHVIDNVETQLNEAGFEKLNKAQEWELMHSSTLLPWSK